MTQINSSTRSSNPWLFNFRTSGSNKVCSEVDKNAIYEKWRVSQTNQALFCGANSDSQDDSGTDLNK